MEAEQSPGCTLALDLARHAACWETTDPGYSDLLSALHMQGTFAFTSALLQ